MKFCCKNVNFFSKSSSIFRKSMLYCSYIVGEILFGGLEFVQYRKQNPIY